MTVLAGDIGGTKTHLAICDIDGGNEPLREKKYPSDAYKSLEAIAKEFLAEGNEPVVASAFGIAGPVKDGVCKATNLPWVVDAKKMGEDLKISSVFLLNDLEANAWGLECLREDEFATLNVGTADRGNRALISAGTGLGEAGLYFDGSQYHPFACEGGHVDFSAHDEVEVQLFRWLQKKYGHASWERALSGMGFVNLYHFLIETGEEKEEEHVEDKDLARFITEKALKKESPLCMRVLDWFVSLYGREAGNLALKMYALGGLYIGGGIAPKILPAMQGGLFMQSFLEKGRLRSLLEKIPVKVVLNDNTALLGAMRYARKKAS